MRRIDSQSHVIRCPGSVIYNYKLFRAQTIEPNGVVIADDKVHVRVRFRQNPDAENVHTGILSNADDIRQS